MKTLFVNGRVYTLDPGKPEVTAIAVSGGRITAVGRNQEILDLKGPGDEVIDLEGRAALPGFTDSHAHFLSFCERFEEVDLEGAASLEEALRRVREGAAAAPAAAWITGGGWNKNLWGGFPTRLDLDRVVPARPVALSSKDGHALWVNSKALAAAGVTGETADPPNGAIQRGADGEPTGILFEFAQELVYRHVPPRTPEDNARLLRRGIREAHARGLVGVHCPEGAASFRAFQDLRAAGELDFRVFMMIPAEELQAAAAVGLRTGFGDEFLRVGAIKAFADGALGPQTACMIADYEGRPGYRGIPTTTPEAMRELVASATRAGLSMAVHAIGDLANRLVLDAYEAVAGESRARGLRHRIEHAQLLHPDDLPRFAALGVIASVQPIHATSDRYIADRHWGARARLAYAFRSLLNSGARLCFGSDAPVESIDPLKGIYAAVTRKREDEPASEPWYPKERLSVEEAVRGYTDWAAYASYEERRRGTLSPGKLADLVVLSRDIFREPPEVIPETRVLMTVVGGKVVHRV